jgi:hypothetical protein
MRLGQPCVRQELDIRFVTLRILAGEIQRGGQFAKVEGRFAGHAAQRPHAVRIASQGIAIHSICHVFTGVKTQRRTTGGLSRPKISDPEPASYCRPESGQNIDARDDGMLVCIDYRRSRAIGEEAEFVF